MSSSLLKTGLKRRCPRCAEGHVFSSYLKIAPACDHCGLSFEGTDTADGPAFFVMMPLSIAIMVLALLFEYHAHPPLWQHMVIWPAFIALAVGFLLPPVKATLVGLQYRYRDVQSDDHNTWV